MKKLGFGLMRLPVIDGKPDNIDLNTLSQMVDLYLERGFTYFDTSYVYHNGAPHDRYTVQYTYFDELSAMTEGTSFWLQNSPPLSAPPRIR